jgi:YVTN family beta-propeller protein
VSDDGSLHTATALGGNPDGIAYGDGSVWVVDRSGGAVRRLNTDAHTSVRIEVGDQPESIAASGNNVWVANFGSRSVSWINTTSNTVVQTIPVGNQPAAIAAGPAGVWVANSGDDTIQKIDPNTATAGPAIGVGDGPAALAVGDDTVWVANARDGTVSRVDTHAGATLSGPIFVGSGPRGLALTPEGVWVANSLSQTVDRINPVTGQIDRTINVGDGPSVLSATPQAVWVANEFDGTVARIDARSGAWLRYAVGSSPRGLASDGKRIWLATGAFGSTAHSGGTLTVAGRPVPGDFVGIDPANVYIQFALQAERPVYDGLVGMREIGGLAGQTLVPDLAVALPRPSPDGRSYTFTIRSGIRYSSGREVLAEDFRRGLARALRGTTGRSDFYTKVIGAPACIADIRACGLASGVDTDNAKHRVIFHLTAPDPDFLYKLTYFVFPMPSDVPLTVQRKPIPGTGPYQISADYREQLVAGDPRGENFSLVRNHYFRQWSFAAQPAGYPDVIRFQATPGAVEAAELVLASKADITHPNNPPDSKPMPDGYVASLARQYPALIRPERLPETDYLNLNTQLRPFNDLRARQAVNYALDRKVVQSLVGETFATEPTCQLLPPDFPGYQPYCPWTENPSPDGDYHGPDLAKAQQLVAASRTRGARVLVYSLVGNPEQRLMVYVTQVLKKLGYQARLEVLPANGVNFGIPNDPRSGVQVSPTGWGADYPRPATFYFGLLDCASFKHSSDNGNIPEFCDPSLDQAVASATALESTDPGAAVRAFAEFDRRVTDEAPIVPYGSSVEPFLVSPRLGNFQFSPYTGPLLSQAWVK